MKFLQLARQLNLPVVHTMQNAYNLVRRELDINLSEVCMNENISVLPQYQQDRVFEATDKYIQLAEQL